MPASVAQKPTIVTGSACGIAAAAVAQLVKEGASVVSFDRSDDAGQRVAREATEAGPGRATHRHSDVLDRAPVVAGIDAGSRFVTGPVIAVNGGLGPVR